MNLFFVENNAVLVSYIAMAKRSTASLVKYVRLLTEAGVMEKPAWLNAVQRMPPPASHLGRQGKRPPTLNYPEDAFVQAYYRKNPAARLEPIDLGSFQPCTARRFAYRQLELIEGGLTRREAKAQVELEFGSGKDAPVSVGQRLIDTIQIEEESHLEEALETFKKKHQDTNEIDQWGSFLS